MCPPEEKLIANAFYELRSKMHHLKQGWATHGFAGHIRDKLGILGQVQVHVY
jgi:hypothetical protein